MELQIVAAIFVLFAISRVYLRFKERKLSSFNFLFWNLVWIGGLSVVLFPNLSSQLAHIVGIGRGADAIIYASIVVIFYLLFRIYIKLEDTNKQITELARKVSLQEVKTPKQR